ncbi:hypothetical protein F5Y15DRAFT_326591 [Xylariaceae sp. FL0016]|nr:hypothetical protein F5Y15DRAFT_326591 [Xylariaceae sp. FL0016]
MHGLGYLVILAAAVPRLVSAGGISVSYNLQSTYNGTLTIHKDAYKQYCANNGVALPPSFDVAADPIQVTAGTGVCAAGDPNKITSFPADSGLEGDLCVPGGGALETDDLHKRDCSGSCYTDCVHLIWDEGHDAYDTCLDSCIDAC